MGASADEAKATEQPPALAFDPRQRLRDGATGCVAISADGRYGLFIVENNFQGSTEREIPKVDAHALERTHRFPIDIKAIDNIVGTDAWLPCAEADGGHDPDISAYRYHAKVKGGEVVVTFGSAATQIDSETRSFGSWRRTDPDLVRAPKAVYASRDTGTIFLMYALYPAEGGPKLADVRVEGIVGPAMAVGDCVAVKAGARTTRTPLRPFQAASALARSGCVAVSADGTQALFARLESRGAEPTRRSLEWFGPGAGADYWSWETSCLESKCSATERNALEAGAREKALYACPSATNTVTLSGRIFKVSRRADTLWLVDGADEFWLASLLDDDDLVDPAIAPEVIQVHDGPIFIARGSNIFGQKAPIVTVVEGPADLGFCPTNTDP